MDVLHLTRPHVSFLLFLRLKIYTLAYNFGDIEAFGKIIFIHYFFQCKSVITAAYLITLKNILNGETQWSGMKE